LEILRDDCGVIVSAWLPYNTIVIPLAAVLAKVGPKHGPMAAQMREKLVRWFWCSVFGQAYESASNTQAAKDMTELLDWLDGGKAPDSVANFRFDPRMLRDTTARQRAVYRGTIALVLSSGPRDFHSRAPLTKDLIIENNVDDHHIFPDAYLRKRDVPSRSRDCVLNRTLIDRKTNMSIGSRPPSAYMKDIREALPATFQELLTSHHLPVGPTSPLWNDNFDAFLDWRQESLWQAIKRVTGVTEAADIVTEETVA
jgi:hypothetical protein